MLPGTLKVQQEPHIATDAAISMVPPQQEPHNAAEAAEEILPPIPPVQVATSVN